MDNKPTTPAPLGEAVASLRYRDTAAEAGARPRSAILCQLLDYWLSKCGPDGRLPGRRDLDPLELRGLLPYIYLVDVAAPGVYRLRLLGSVHAAVYGDGHTGKTMEEIFLPEHVTAFNAMYNAVVRRRQPIVNRGQLVWWKNKEWIRFEGLHAPLAGDGTTIDTIFAAGVFENI